MQPPAPQPSHQPIAPAPAAAAPGRPAAQFPPLDIYALGNEVVLTAALPGLTTPDHVAIYLTGPRELLLEVFLPPEQNVGMNLIRERPTGYFARTVTLPAAVSPHQGAVRLENGVLEVRLANVDGAAGANGISVIQVTPPT